LLSQICEVFTDIVVPWHRDIKEKRDLLREDPFLGFVAVAVLGAVFYYFFRQSPSWIGFILLYSGMAMFILGSIAAVSAKWVGWTLFRRAAWPIAIFVLVIYGCTDTYLVITPSEPVRLKGYRIEEGAVTFDTQTDEIKRFTGRPLYRWIDTSNQIAGRTVRRTLAEGPLNSAGQKHGRWVVSTLVPKNNFEIITWYWKDKEMNQTQWDLENKK
jgi:hypothetical protein